MHKPHALATLAVCVGLLAGCQKKEETVAAAADDQGSPVIAGLESDSQKFGYAVGVDLANALKPVKDDVDMSALKQGLDETLAGQTPRMDDKARQEIKNQVARKVQQKQVEERATQGKTNLEAGEKFLAENAKREGVKTTGTGLQYEVLQEGSGESPKATDRVTVHYKGTLIDGTEFDSSYTRGQPVSFPLQNVIPGWTEGLQLMKPGAKYKLFVPPALGYGERGAGAKIGPNSTLVFEVELVSVEAGGAADKKLGPQPKKDAKKAETPAEAKPEEPKKE